MTLNWVNKESQKLKDESRWRQVRQIPKRDVLNFSSNNYLGLARHPRVIAAAQQALQEWGTGATASRLISGTIPIHPQLETALAQYAEYEAALVFPSGYMTNLGVITALVGAGDAVVMDRLCHASLIDAVKLSGARLFVYAHKDLNEAERALQRTVSYRRRLLITDSLFSMDGDFAPLKELLVLCRQYGVMSLADDAHAFGIWNTTEISEFGIRNLDLMKPIEKVQDDSKAISKQSSTNRQSAIGNPQLMPDLLVGTLSKTLGSQGGFVCASQSIIDWIINKARSFIYTTGLAPTSAAAALAALRLLQTDHLPREKLKKNASLLREGLAEKGFDILKSSSQIVPILLGDIEFTLALSKTLETKGIYAPAIRPPTVPKNGCRLRFSVTAEHSESDIERLLGALNE